MATCEKERKVIEEDREGKKENKKADELTLYGRRGNKISMHCHYEVTY